VSIVPRTQTSPYLQWMVGVMILVAGLAAGFGFITAALILQIWSFLLCTIIPCLLLTLIGSLMVFTSRRKINELESKKKTKMGTH
jgi:CHASE2 domain-containing sensor protein